MRIKGFVQGVAVPLTIVAFTLVLSTCGGGGSRAVNPLHIRSGGLQTAGSTGSLEVYQPGGLAAPHRVPLPQSLDDALVELAGMECPEGVEGALFAQLKEALREALQTKSTMSRRGSLAPQGEEPGWLARPTHGVRKFASTPPTGEANRVDDLELIDNGDGTFALEWTYKNVGDYDQNGKVAIADITPLAQHFNETYDPETEPHCIQAVIDGSGNGSIGIEDVTPIAQCFNVDCAGYAIRSASSYPNSLDETSEIGTAGIALAAGEGRKAFDVPLPPSEYWYCAVAPYDADDGLGELSNVVHLNEPPVADLIANPTTGDAPLEVTFDASASIDPDGEIVNYEWDFDGDGDYDDETAEPANVYTYESPAVYESALRVTDDDGAQATESVTITVNEPSEWWHIVIVDSAGDVGTCLSLAIVNGNPAISYYDYTNESLKYARASDADGSSWGSPLTLDSAGDVGRYTSLTVVNGNPAISYFDGDNAHLKYVRANDADGTSWGSPKTVDSATNRETSLAIVNGNPAIGYFVGNSVKYARAVDANGSNWSTTYTVVSATDVGWYLSLAIVNGNPAISYYIQGPNYDLKYVRASDADGTSWGSPLTVESDGDVGSYLSLAIVNGNPAISYFDFTNWKLKYVRASDPSGNNWSMPAIVDSDSEGLTGMATSLCVVNGNPAISYYDVANYDLKYARATDADGAGWNTYTVDSAGEVGSYTSLAVVNGNPAIGYYDGTNDNLKFAIYY